MSAENADPFGLAHLRLETLRERPGVKWRAPGGRIAAWIADMDFPIAPAIVERLHARVVDLGYPAWDETGRSPLAARFAARMASRYGWEPDRERLRELSDVMQGIAMAIHHLSEPGDGVLVHTPSYPPFLRAISEQHRRLVPVPARPATDGVVFDYDELERRLAALDQPPRMWILCHPQNPTGRVFASEELARIAAIAERFDLVVISDEIHADLVHEPHRHVPFASLGGTTASRTITVTSSSKAFNLAGMRWAIMHVGVDHLSDQLASIPRHYLGEPSLLAVEATDAAWTDGDAWLAAVRTQLDENRTLLRDLLARHLPDVGYDPPEATYLAWLDCRRLELGDDPAATFRSRGVELASGPNFGPDGHGWARLNFATSPTVLEQIVERMAG